MNEDPRHDHTAASRQDSAKASTNEPIVLDLGKKNRRQVRKLTRGKPGRLLNRVEEAIDHLRESGAIATDTQPVVIVIRQRSKSKSKRRGRRFGRLWGLG